MNKYLKLPNKATLERHFYYNETPGKLFWKEPTSIRAIKHKEVGFKDKNGYICLGFKGKEYKIHRIIWMMHYGEIDDTKQIDHKDCNPLNNHILNLHLVTDAENKLNLPIRKTNKTGITGVHWDRGRNKWFAQIQRNKITTALGRFDSFEDAVKIRKEAEQKTTS